MFELIEKGLGLSIVEFFQKGVPGEILWYLLYPFNLIGSEIGYLVILPVIYWSINKSAGKRLLILTLAGSIITCGLKNWWKRPRPFQVDPVKIKHLSDTTEYGLPSGHTIFATATGLWTIDYFKKKKVTIIVLIGILLMGISRMVHGMHYPQDVVTGLLLGALFFGIYYFLSPKIELWFKKSSFQKGMLYTFLLLVISYVIIVLVSDQYEARKSVLSPLGALVGGIAGILLEEKYIAFTTNINMKFRIIRGVIGLLVLITFYLLFDVSYYAFFKNDPSLLSMMMYTIRYMLVGCTVTFFVPLLFKLLKI
jgi:membrane-associated phospholipid phosphatase